jgi:ABC-type sugar transport system, periplasmic component
MKKIVYLVLVLVLAFSLVACGGGAKEEEGGLVKIGIVNLHPSESGYRAANVADMDAAFNEANGYDVQKANYNTLNEQIDAAQQFITSGVDYLLIAAQDKSGWNDVLKAAQDAGTRVFLFDRMIDCDESLYEAAVVSDMENQGKLAVQWLKEQNLEEYNIIHIQGAMGSDAQIGRTDPLQAEIDAGNMTLVRRGSGGGDWSPDEAKKIVEAAIAAGEKFNIIYAENDGMAEGAMKALDEAGITHGVNGDVIIMGFDCNKFALRYLLDGSWNFDGQCSPFQASVIAGFIEKLESGQELGLADKVVINEETYFEAGKITQEDIDKYGLGQ